jgi:hypothetical protein
MKQTKPLYKTRETKQLLILESSLKLEKYLDKQLSIYNKKRSK